jgi:mannan endo-1,4-beta-mannosidase
LDGREFPVVGVNCYYLAHCSDAARDDTLAVIKTMGATVVRCLGFLNVKDKPAAGTYFQYHDGETIVINAGPDGLGRFDALIAAAEAQEFRLILPLVNFWKAFGGMQMYLEWLFPGEELAPEEFYRRPQARAAYKKWIGHVVNRYRDSPAIFAWELANEPRCQVAGGRELLLDWAQEIAQFMKSQDPNHLVALGDEGFLRHHNAPNHLYSGEYGVDFEATLGISEIDFGTYHFYPAKKQMNVPLKFASTWIVDHIAAGGRANKPVIMEEYGIAIGDHGVASAIERDAWYAHWLEAVYENDGSGDLLWMVGSHEASVKDFRDEYTVYSGDEVPLAIHAENMRTRAGFE